MKRGFGPAVRKAPPVKRTPKEHKSILEMPKSVDPQRVRRAKYRAQVTREYRESIRDIYHETDYLKNTNETSQFIVALERTGSAAGMVSGRNSAMSSARAESRQLVQNWSGQASPRRDHDFIPRPGASPRENAEPANTSQEAPEKPLGDATPDNVNTVEDEPQTTDDEQNPIEDVPETTDDEPNATEDVPETTDDEDNAVGDQPVANVEGVAE